LVLCERCWRILELGSWCFSGGWMLDVGVSWRVMLRVRCFQFRHPYRLVKTRTDRHAFDAVSRGLNGTSNHLSGEHRVHAAGRLFSFSDRVDDFAAAIGAIAAGEDLRKICLTGLQIMDDHAAPIQFELRK